MSKHTAQPLELVRAFGGKPGFEQAIHDLLHELYRELYKELA